MKKDTISMLKSKGFPENELCFSNLLTKVRLTYYIPFKAGK